MRTEITAFFLGVFLLIFIGGCEEKPDFIGGDLLPSGDQIKVSFDSASHVYGYTRIADSLRVGSKTVHYLGSYTDPFFGFTKAELVTTVGTTVNSGGFGPNPKHDSVILNLYAFDFNGNGTAPQEFSIYELTEQLQSDSSYYTSFNPEGKYRSPALGTGAFSPSDSSFRIEITDTNYIKRFMSTEDSILLTNIYLQDVFFGYYFAMEDASDAGGIFYLNFDDPRSNLRFHYSNDTASSLVREYSFENDRNGRINMYEHDKEGSLVNEYLNNGSENDSLMFFQSLAGLNSVIYFPDLERWRDSMPVAINEVKLKFTLADTNITGSSARDFPSGFFVYMILDDGRITVPYDFQLDAEGFGGTVNTITHTFEYTLKAQVQSIATGDLENLRMMLIPASPDETITRGGIYGWSNDPAKRPRMEIIYTLL